MELTFLILIFLSTLHNTITSEVHFTQKLHFLQRLLADNQMEMDIHVSSWTLNQKHQLSKLGISLFTNDSFSQRNGYTKMRIYDCTKTSNIKIVKDNAPILLLTADNAHNVDMLRPVDTLPKRNIIMAKFRQVREDFMVKMVRCYRLEESLPLIEEYLLTWTPSNAASLNLLRFPRKRMNFQGLKLPVGIVLRNPQSTQRLEDFRDQWTDTYSKINYGPIMKLFNYYNITPEFSVLQDYKHISTKNKFILTVAAPYMTKELIQFVDFVKVAPATKLCYLIRRPPTSFVTTIFTVTFSSGVWYSTIGLVAILSTALYVLLNIEARRKDIKGQTNFSIYDLLLIGFEAICQQGTVTDPSSYASRTLTVLMFMALMFLYVAYSANILVLLQSTSAIHKPEELSEYGIDYSGMDTSNFSYYTDQIGESLFQTNINATKRLSVDEGMRRVREGIFAFFTESHYGQQYAKYFYTDYDVCGLQEFAARYDFSLGYTAIPKDSPYYELFKVALLQIFETGFSNRHYLRYFLKPECYSKGSSFDEIGIREIYQAILLVAIGVGCGLLVLCIEIALDSMQQRKEILFLN